MNELRFDGRSVIVTGGGRGQGRCHSLLLASRGARVLVVDNGAELDGSGSSPEPANDVVAEILANGGEAVACYASVAEKQGVAAIVETALDAFGRLDAVINNAGIIDEGFFDELTLEQHERMVDIMYYGTLCMMREAWPHMRAAGYGRIVNVTSESFFGIGLPKLSSYAGPKGGVFGITRNLAIEGAPHGILVNAIMPRASTRMENPTTMASLMCIPVEEYLKVSASFPRMPPEMVSPVASFFAHESCQLNGEVFAAGRGQVQRFAVYESRGYENPDLTIEDVAANLDEIMNLADQHLMLPLPNLPAPA